MPIPKSQKSPSRGLFGRYKGKMTLSQIRQHLNLMSLRPLEREYAMRVFEKHHHPASPHITEQEFRRALEEMAENPCDPIKQETIGRLKKRFGL